MSTFSVFDFVLLAFSLVSNFPRPRNEIPSGNVYMGLNIRAFFSVRESLTSACMDCGG